MLFWARTEQPVKAALAACFLLYNLRKCSSYAIGGVSFTLQLSIALMVEYKYFYAHLIIKHFPTGP